MAEITDVEIVADRTVELTFADGSTRRVDLTPYLWGPVFAAIAKDDALFAQVTVDSDLGTITWPSGVHLDPEVLHGDYEATQPWKQPHH